MRPAVLEGFVELLKVRAELIEESRDMPPEMIEAISSLVFATQRLNELPELQVGPCHHTMPQLSHISGIFSAFESLCHPIRNLQPFSGSP